MQFAFTVLADIIIDVTFILVRKVDFNNGNRKG